MILCKKLRIMKTSAKFCNGSDSNPAHEEWLDEYQYCGGLIVDDNFDANSAKGRISSIKLKSRMTGHGTYPVGNQVSLPHIWNFIFAGNNLALDSADPATLKRILIHGSQLSFIFLRHVIIMIFKTSQHIVSNLLQLCNTIIIHTIFGIAMIVVLTNFVSNIFVRLH